MYKIERVDDEPRTEMIDELGLLAAESFKKTLYIKQINNTKIN